MNTSLASVLVSVLGGFVGGAFALSGQLLQVRLARTGEMRKRSEDAARAALDAALEMRTLLYHEGCETTNGWFLRSAALDIDRKKMVLVHHVNLVAEAEL